MTKLKIIYLIAITPFIFLMGIRVNAIEVNCDSPVWRKKDICNDKTQSLRKSQYGGWYPFGFDKNGNPVSLAQLLSYQSLNENSFRLNTRFTYPDKGKIDGKLDVNCKNKDYYVRTKRVNYQRKNWVSIPVGSGVEGISKYFCKRTSGKAQWGYTESSKYLWNSIPPIARASDVSGEWIQHSDGIGWYNNQIIKQQNSVIYAFFLKTNGKYMWVKTSCKENLRTISYQPDKVVPKIWLSPTAGRPGGIDDFIRKNFCS